MNKKTIRDVELKGKRVLVRVDFNVPLANGEVQDDTRIESALPTLRFILEAGGSAILMSHLGRPKGQPSAEYSLAPVAKRLAKLLDVDVEFAPDCIGAEVQALADTLEPGQVLLLENLRFHPEEEGKVTLPDDASEEAQTEAKAAMAKAQRDFAQQLASLADIYVCDAFGTAHRAHASMAAVPALFEERVAGFLLEQEIQYLGKAIREPERPFMAILGGAKISGKIDVIRNLLDKVDTIIVGGGMVYTFYKAKGLPVGNSLVEDDRIEMALETLKQIEEKGVKFLLPIDHVVADAFNVGAQTRIVEEDGIPDEWMALDIGPKSIELFSNEISRCRTVVWNGPMGCFEMAPFAEGTMAIAKAVAEADCVSVIGGGDSVSAVNKSGLADQMTHISTGGGASLEFLEGKALPGIEALSDK